MNQQNTPGKSAPVPTAVGRYAAYLCGKTYITPETTVDGDHADVRVSTGDAALVLVFRCGGTGEWSLRRAEVQCGAHTATFARGQVAKATAVFLGHEPLTPDVPAGKDRDAF